MHRCMIENVPSHWRWNPTHGTGRSIQSGAFIQRVVVRRVLIVSTACFSSLLTIFVRLLGNDDKLFGSSSNAIHQPLPWGFWSCLSRRGQGLPPSSRRRQTATVVWLGARRHALVSSCLLTTEKNVQSVSGYSNLIVARITRGL